MTYDNVASPVQGTPYRPVPTAEHLRAARGIHVAPRCIPADRTVWRDIRGTNTDPVFPGVDPHNIAAIKARKAVAFASAGFASGRREGIEALLRGRHGAQCDTDDAEVWLDAAIPFVVEAAEIRGYSGVIAGLRWGRKFCPLVSSDIVAGIVSMALDRRDASVAHFNATGRHLDWLPGVDELKSTLRIRWQEVTTFGLRGFASIDPPSSDERRERKTEQRRQQRRAKGVKSIDSRTLMQSRKRIADCFGVDVRTIQRWEVKGVVPAERVQNLSLPCMDLIRGDTNWTSLIPANDDVEAPPPPLTMTGYQGRHITMTVWQVRDAITRHPAIEADLRLHLDAIDTLMMKTPPETRQRVLRNLLQDRNRLAKREHRRKVVSEAAAA